MYVSGHVTSRAREGMLKSCEIMNDYNLSLLFFQVTISTFSTLPKFLTSLPQLIINFIEMTELSSRSSLDILCPCPSFHPLIDCKRFSSSHLRLLPSSPSPSSIYSTFQIAPILCTRDTKLEKI